MDKEVRYMEFPSFYDLFSFTNTTLKQKKSFFRKIAKEHSSITELGAGTGTIALDLATIPNKKLICVEPAAAVLNTLWSKIIERNLNDVTVLPQTAQQFTLSQKASLVIIPNLIHLIITEKERRDILLNTHRNMVKGGIMVISFFNYKKIRTTKKRLTGKKQMGDIVCKRYTEIKPVEHSSFKLSRITWFFKLEYKKRVIKTFKEEFVCRYDSIDYIQKLLNKCHFKISRICEDYYFTHRQNNGNADNLIIIAEAI